MKASQLLAAAAALVAFAAPAWAAPSISMNAVGGRGSVTFNGTITVDAESDRPSVVTCDVWPADGGVVTSDTARTSRTDTATAYSYGPKAIGDGNLPPGEYWAEVTVTITLANGTTKKVKGKPVLITVN